MTYLLYNETNKYILNKLLGSGLTCKCFLGQKKLSPKELQTQRQERFINFGEYSG